MDHYTSPSQVVEKSGGRCHSKDMKTKRNNGFGLQRTIEGGEAVLLLRITNPRRLNVKSLGEVLLKYLTGGYKTLVLDQGGLDVEPMPLIHFLGRLQATMNLKRDIRVEKMIRNAAY